MCSPVSGPFADCMRNLEQGGFVEPILRVIREGRPFLGICLGLQLLFTESEEFGLHQGLDVIPGRVVRFPEGMEEGGEELKVPHMGWNQLAFKRRPPLFAGLDEGTNVLLCALLLCEARGRRRSWRPPPATASSSVPPSGRTMLLPPSFIRRNPRRRGCRC